MEGELTMSIQEIAGIGAMEFFILSFIVPLWNRDRIVKYKRNLESLSLIMGFWFLSVYFYLKGNSDLAALCLCLFVGMLALAFYIQIFKREKIEIRTLPEDSYRIYTEDVGNTATIHVHYRIVFEDQEYLIAAPSIVGTPALKLYVHKDQRGRVTNVDAVPMKSERRSIKDRFLVAYMNIFFTCALLSPIVYLLLGNIELMLYYIFILVFAYSEIMFRGAGNLLIRVLHVFSIFMMLSMVGVFVSLLL
jgi:hypothetical protein